MYSLLDAIQPPQPSITTITAYFSSIDGCITAISTFTLAILTCFIAYYAFGAYRASKDTLQTSKDDLLASKKNFELERFENRFFEMINIYRENVDEMQMQLPESNAQCVTGRLVFKEIHRHYIMILDTLNYWVKSTNYKLKSEKELLQITALIIFFGFSNLGVEMLIYYFNKLGYTKNDEFIIHILYDIHLGQKKANFSDATHSYPYYEGNQERLGHYLRHLYFSINFVHNQPFLSRTQKYDYVKMLRTQMSTYEQSILFFNAFSPMGSAWEFSKRDNDYKLKCNSHGISYKLEDLLITEYALIKNIPVGFTKFVDPKHFFSKLNFEGEVGEA